MSICVPIENGMVIGAQDIWERMYAPTPWDCRQDRYVVDFIEDQDLGAEVIAHELETDPDAIDAASASLLFSALPMKRKVVLAERYILFNDLTGSYNDYVRGEE